MDSARDFLRPELIWFFVGLVLLFVEMVVLLAALRVVH